jgi:hypothetical protein
MPEFAVALLQPDEWPEALYADAEELLDRLQKHAQAKHRWRDKRRITKKDREGFRRLASDLYELDVRVRIEEAKTSWMEECATVVPRSHAARQAESTGLRFSFSAPPSGARPTQRHARKRPGS